MLPHPLRDYTKVHINPADGSEAIGGRVRSLETNLVDIASDSFDNDYGNDSK